MASLALTPAHFQALEHSEALLKANQPGHLAIAKLRANHGPDLAIWAWEMAQVRQRALAKNLPDMLFTREALEQATRQELANHRAKRLENHGALIELGASCGGDTVAFAKVTRGIAVEKDPVRCLYLHHNLQANQGRFLAVQGDALRFGTDLFGCGFADPARREEGRRTLDLDSYSPPLARLLKLLPNICGIKLAPAQNPEEVFASTLSAATSLEWVGWQSELKELVLWRGLEIGGKRVATILPAGASLAWPETAPPEWPETREVQGFLYDPHPAVVRAGLVGLLARQIKAFPIDSQIAFLSNQDPTFTPFARTFEVLAVFPFSLKTARQELRANDIGTVEIIKRGSAVDAEELRKALKTKGRGHSSLILSRAMDKHVGIVAKPLVGQPGD